MTVHRVRDIRFVPRTSTGVVWCSCGTEMEYLPLNGFGNLSDTFSQHRRDAGAGPSAQHGYALATEDSPAFMARVCRRGHTERWRTRLDGRSECVRCVRDLQRESRRRAKAA